MKLVEPSTSKGEGDQLQKYTGIFKRVVSKVSTGEQAEQAIIARFLRSLDNRYIMFHNLQVGSPGVPFPPILIGPPGLFLINISHEKGFFKATEDFWWEMDKRTRSFNPSPTNLIKQTMEFAQKLGMLMDVHGKAHPEIIPILIFANPGVHVESAKPSIRIVLMDGVDNLIANLFRGGEMLRYNEVNYLSDALEVMANPEKAIPQGQGEDFFGQDLSVPEKKTPPKMPTINLPTEMPLPSIGDKLKLTRKQWVMVAILLFFTIMILLAVILFILSTF